MQPETFCDVVEFGRRLVVDVQVGMVHLQLEGGRPITAETFRLDSEDAEAFAAAIGRAAAEVRRESPLK